MKKSLLLATPLVALIAFGGYAYGCVSHGNGSVLADQFSTTPSAQASNSSQTTNSTQSTALQSTAQSTPQNVSQSTAQSASQTASSANGVQIIVGQPQSVGQSQVSSSTTVTNAQNSSGAGSTSSVTQTSTKSGAGPEVDAQGEDALQLLDGEADDDAGKTGNHEDNAKKQREVKRDEVEKSLLASMKQKGDEDHGAASHKEKSKGHGHHKKQPHLTHGQHDEEQGQDEQQGD